MNATNAIRISRALLLLARRLLLASRRDKAVIVVDENQFGIVPGLRALGYNNIKTFPAGTPDQVIHDALNKMRQRIRRKAILLVTENADDFTKARRGTEPLYNVVTPGGMAKADIPAKIDWLIQNMNTKINRYDPVYLATLK